MYTKLLILPCAWAVGAVMSGGYQTTSHDHYSLLMYFKVESAWIFGVQHAQIRISRFKLY